jgi:hypothetical protein
MFNPSDVTGVISVIEVEGDQGAVKATGTPLASTPTSLMPS